ncbi:MAG: DUF4402 domain-containing protein [Bacteroidales bacterium]|jgi:hypothetical protein|nr:DUF4402 domain-containing protein [Bacteroidales bacterium]OPZ99554.1 MAG: hypothetical protein BWY72_00300 [Bacteroidetes bacterium ADurb.Bin416]
MKTNRLLLTLAAIAASVTCAFSQVTATGHIAVTIVTPISITKTQDMNFGHVSVESGMGRVTLSPESQARQVSGDVELMDGGAVSVASFKVKGYQGATFSISLPQSPVMISNGNKSMMVTDFTSTPSGFGDLSDGSKDVKVGATLVVTGDQILGEYASVSPFPVTVNYN